jgi:hypothetical protein
VISSETQSLVPSDAKKWRVFSSDGENVELISMDGVGELTIGGEYGYRNLISILNNVSEAYIDSNYAISARHLGYSEEGLTDVENYKVLSATKYPVVISKTVAKLYSDEQYKSDVEIIDNNPLLRTYKISYLASRYYGILGEGVLASGVMGPKILITDNVSSGGFLLVMSKFAVSITGDDEIAGTNTTAQIRPIVKLKSGLKVVSGDGSYNNPYIITQ